MTDDASPAAPVYRLRLVIAGKAERSSQAIANLRRILAEHLETRFELEVIDLYQQPELAEKYQVIAAPTLVKLLPLPVRRIIGNLSMEDKVLRGLDLEPL